MRIHRMLIVPLMIAAAYGLSLDAQPASGQGGVYGIPLAAVYQPPYEQMEVFVVGPEGAIHMVWKERNSKWRPPVILTGPGFAPPGAPIAAVFQPRNNQVEVFVVGNDGAIWDLWKDNNGPWKGPIRLTEPDFAYPGTGIAAVFQPRNDQLEVFVIGSDGAIWDVHKAQNGPWQRPIMLTQSDIALRQGQITAVYQPRNEQLEVFFVGRNGAVHDVYKGQNGPWQPPITISPRDFAPPGAPISAVSYPEFEALEVFIIGNDGMLRGMYKANNSAWKSDLTLSPPGLASPRAGVVAVYQPRNEQLEVFVVDKGGAINLAWKAQHGAWNQARRITPANHAADGTALAGVFQALNDQLEVFVIDDKGAIRDTFKGQNGPWTPSVEITAPYLLPFFRPADCTAMLRRWQRGGVNTTPDDYQWEQCMWIMGFADHCRAKGAFVTVQYGGPAGNDKSLACAPYARPMDILEELGAVAVGTLQVVATTLAVAGVVYSCLQIPNPFTCALIPLTAFQLAGVDPGPAGEAIRIGSEVVQCATLDVASCVSLGQRGLEATGVTIPGLNAGEIAAAVQSCRADSFAGCARVAFAAVEAAGVAASAAGEPGNMRDCLAGQQAACQALGGKAARAKNLPLGQITDGVQRGARCADGDTAACLSLGGDLARAAGFPLDEVLDGVARGQQCAGGNTDACIELARAAARALNLPLDTVLNGVANARRCADGDSNACLTLGTALAREAGFPLVDVLDGVNRGQQCAAGNRDACISLAKSAARAVNLPLDRVTDGVANARRCFDGDTAVCLSLGTSLARGAGFPLGDVLDGVDRGQKCVAGDRDACIGLAKDAARALDFPLNGVLDGVASARSCASGDNNACINLGKALVGSAVPAGAESAVRCATGNNEECGKLGAALVKAGIAHAVAASGPFADTVRASACGAGNVQACQELARAFIRPVGSPPPPPGR